MLGLFHFEKNICKGAEDPDYKIKKSLLCGKIKVAADRCQHHKDYSAIPITPISLTEETTTRKLCSELQGCICADTLFKPKF